MAELTLEQHIAVMRKYLDHGVIESYGSDGRGDHRESIRALIAHVHTLSAPAPQQTVGVADPEHEPTPPDTAGTWEERCHALYQVVGCLADACGIFESSDDVANALDVAAGRGDVNALLPWPKDAALYKQIKSVNAASAPSPTSPEQQELIAPDIEWLHKFISCMPFGPDATVSNITRTHDIVIALSRSHEDGRRAGLEDFHAGTLAALDVVFLHDNPVIAAEIVQATDSESLLKFAIKDEYYNLANLRKVLKTTKGVA